MPQNTNLNISPYFDDFDKANNFYRVLFRPGYPIQARELTTMQSLMQNQVESFGSHMFKDGSMVIPGQIGYDLDAKAVILQGSFLGADVEEYRTQLDGTIISGLTTGVKAKILFSIPASESERGYITLYVKYLTSGGTDSTESTFVDNEQLICESEITYGSSLIEIGTPFAQLLPTNSTAVGSTASITAGVYFIRGYFVDVVEQTIILDQYTNYPSYRVGLEIFESIVTPEDDPGLNDNATGTSNYSAPGGHRFRIRTSLVKKVIDDDTDKNFIELLRINQSQIETFVERTAYNEMARELARRTYDESGDYTVRDFDVRIREHRNDGINGGVYLPGRQSPGGVVSSESHFVTEVGPGKAYVRGYESETLVPTYVDLEKSRSTVALQNSIIPFELGNFFLGNNVKGSPIINGNSITENYQVIEFRDDAPGYNLTASGNIVGYGRVAAFEYHNGTTVNAQATIFKAYVFDLQPLTLMKMSGNVTLAQGHVIRGRSSKAKAFVEADYTGVDLIKVYQVYGTFRDGEVIERDGVEIGTLSDVYKYEITDAKGITGKDPDTNAIIFAMDLLLDQETVIAGTNFNVNGNPGGTLTGTQSNFTLDLRPGDILTVNGVDELQITPISTVSTNIDNQITSATSANYGGNAGPIANADYGFIVRRRPQLYNPELADLMIEMPKASIKSIADESAIVARTFDDITVTGANDFTISLPADEQFLSYDKDHYQLVSLAPTAGTVIDMESSHSFNSTGTPRTSLTVTGLTGVTTARLITSVSKNQAEKKLKNATEMEVMKVERTANSSDNIRYGLTYGSLYGTRIEDEEISLGSTDVYHIHAVYESNDDNAAVIPHLTMQDATIFQNGTIIEGQTSKAKARVVEFNSVSYVCHFVYENNNRFTLGETVNGFDSNGNVISGLVNDADGSINNGSRNITENFFLDPNQLGHYYDIGKLIRYSQASAPLRKLKIVFNRFTHEATGDYFASQSYVGIDYAAIPSIEFNGETRELRDVLDFRPAVTPVLSGSGTVGSPYYVNCASLDFKDRGFSSGGVANNATVIDIPKPESDFRCDYDYYVGRIDKLFLTDQQGFKIIKGIPGEGDDIPANIDNAMLLATLYHEPYGYGPEGVHIVRENNRRFTMRDIGLMERRIDNLEYYTALNLLEMETASLSVKDSDGFDKFKNGFLVDDFTSFDSAATKHEDFACAVDFAEGKLRASHYTTNVALQYTESGSSGVKYHEVGTLTLPYDEVTFIVQPYCSRVENVNPFNVFAYIGRLDLYPSSDDWVDTRRAPDKVVNLEGDFTAQVQRFGGDTNTGLVPTQWNSWRTNWTSSSSRTDTRTMRRGQWPYIRRITTTQTNTTRSQTRSGIRTIITPRVDRQSLGDKTIERTVVPFIRSRNIAFKIQRLKPNTRFYAFIDNLDVNFYTTPRLIEVIKNPVDDNRTNNTPFVTGEKVIGQTSGCRLLLVSPETGFDDGLSPYDQSELPTSYASTTPLLNIDTQTMSETVAGEYFGNPLETEILVGQTSGARAVVKTKRLIANTNGDMEGIMWIPNPAVSTNPRFATGTRVVRLTTSETDSRIPGQVDSSASNTYVASGVIETKQQTILAVRNADVVRDTVVSDRIVNDNSTATRDTGWYDPLAQSFLVESKGGAFLTSADLFFNTKDNRIPVSIQVREMANGYPTTKVLAFSDVTLLPSQINLSENGTVLTKFTFPSPIYVRENREYCLVVLSDSNEYKLWISRMGEDDVTNDRTISEQPYAGVLFKSQNASTWTADQYEDLKFTVYRANFTETSGTVALNNTPQGKGNGGIHRLIDNPIQTIKPKLVLTAGPTNTQYTFSIGARISQLTSNAAATVVSSTTSNSAADTITVTDASGNWLQGTSTTFLLRSSEAVATQVVGSASGTLAVGDVVTGATSGSVGIVKTWNGSNALVLHYITGAFTNSETINEAGGWSATVTSSTESGDSYGAYLSTAPTYASDEKEILIYHRNHGMHQRTNNVKVEGAISEIANTSLTSALAAAATSITVENASLFHQVVNGAAISNANPGYVKIGDEIITYNAISSDGKTITVATSGRGTNGTTDTTHASGAIVECYSLDGIPLIDINKTHTSISCPWLDTYMLHINGVANNGIRAGGNMIYASQNTQFETLTPTVSVMNLPETDITARINTTTATSIGNGSAVVDQSSFVNDGTYTAITLNDLNFFPDPKMICSEVNENAKLDGQKSLTMLIDLSTTKSTLSPVVDLDRCSLITTSNRINAWPGGTSPYGQQSAIDTSQDVSVLPLGDQNDCVYITRLARLIRESRSIRVDFQMSRPPEADVRIYYRAFSTGTGDDIDSIGWTQMDKPLQYDDSPSEEILWKDYYYEVSGLNFNAFQLKIVLRSSNQARVPLIADLRAIALAT